MLSRVKDLPTSHGFPAGSKLFVYNEVIDRNDGAVTVDEYYDTGMKCFFTVHICVVKQFVVRTRNGDGVPLLHETCLGYCRLWAAGWFG